MTQNLMSLDLYDQILACTECPIRGEARRPLGPEGPVDSTVLFLGQNPGDDEDKAGSVFVGRSGKELDEWLNVMRIGRKKVAIANIVHCHTAKNRTPKVKEVQFCRDRWLPPLLAAMPNLQIIIPMGKAAQGAVLKKITVPLLEFFSARVKWDGADYGVVREYTVYPLVHPSYILRNPHERHRQHGVLRQVRDHIAANHAEAYAAVS